MLNTGRPTMWDEPSLPADEPDIYNSDETDEERTGKGLIGDLEKKTRDDNDGDDNNDDNDVDDDGNDDDGNDDDGNDDGDFEKASLEWCRGNSKYGRTQ
jgi:hypothetical protein